MKKPMKKTAKKPSKKPSKKLVKTKKSAAAVTIVEVGLRDGLQNESRSLEISQKVELAKRLANSGVHKLEIGAFVRKEKIPQMAQTADVIKEVDQLVLLGEIPEGTEFPVLVPNMYGLNEAIAAKVKEIALFTAASETFCRKNINCSIDESFERFEEMLPLIKKHKLKVRGYVSTCFGCPYEGKVDEDAVVRVARRLYALGCYEISIGDTIGVANPLQVKNIFTKLKKYIPVSKLAGHFHDTRGTALANILQSYELGIRVFDSSLGGLGGCPYAPGASGNVATEEVVYMFEGMGINTGLDLPKYVETSQWLNQFIPVRKKFVLP